jgi:hypothetical protein
MIAEIKIAEYTDEMQNGLVRVYFDGQFFQLMAGEGAGLMNLSASQIKTIGQYLVKFAEAVEEA